jgi:drug/metabolite transporter (DMT)-like permease
VTLWLAFAATAFAWGSSFLWIKVGLVEGLAPVTLVAYRLWIGALFLALVGRLTGARLPDDRRVLARVGSLGLLYIVAPFTLITWAELWIDSAVASILNGLVPLFTIVIASLFLHDEPITLNRLAGLLIGFGGAVVLLSRNLGPSAAGDPLLVVLGELAVLVASACYASSVVYVRHEFSGRDLVSDPGHGRREMTPVELALPQVFVAAVVATGLAAALEWTRPGTSVTPTTPTAWLAVAWLGLLGSGLAYLLYYRLLHAWGATRSTLVAYAMPIVGLVLGVVVLRETIDLQVILGSGLIIGGIALVNSHVGERRLYGRATAPAPLPRE